MNEKHKKLPDNLLAFLIRNKIPSYHGKDCLANGENAWYECACDECDHYLEQLERLSKAWKAQFDNPPSLPLAWSVDAAGVLTLDGVGVCPASDLAAADAYDVERLRLDLQDGSYVIIEIDWPFEGPARISEIITHKEVVAV